MKCYQKKEVNKNIDLFSVGTEITHIQCEASKHYFKLHCANPNIAVRFKVQTMTYKS